MNSRIGYGIIGLLFSVFFIWIIINGANTFQKKVINIVHSKMDNKLTSGKREYCFDTDGITVSSDIGNGTNHWNAFKCWGFNPRIFLSFIEEFPMFLRTCLRTGIVRFGNPLQTDGLS